MADLVERLTEAATAAIQSERAALESPAGRVRGLTLELVLSGDGLVTEAVAYVERRTSGGALFARKIEQAG